MIYDPCPKCGAEEGQRYNWKGNGTDGKPTHQRHRCYACGHDTGWFPWGEKPPPIQQVLR